MTPHDTYSIPIHVRKITLAYISHKQKQWSSIIEQT